ncbi:MAG: hypothetical protein DRP35_01350 [Candidatus Zixiibacteriota bacterium]|nr:MAG: hypothetical protein DRP35_01350 [candidate division Zixibacteria bacterium]
MKKILLVIFVLTLSCNKYNESDQKVDKNQIESMQLITLPGKLNWHSNPTTFKRELGIKFKTHWDSDKYEKILYFEGGGFVYTLSSLGMKVSAIRASFLKDDASNEKLVQLTIIAEEEYNNMKFALTRKYGAPLDESFHNGEIRSMWIDNKKNGVAVSNTSEYNITIIYIHNDYNLMNKKRELDISSNYKL